MSTTCCAELQQVSPAPPRTVRLGFARLRPRQVLGGGDRLDALSPGASGGVAPGRGVGGPQQRVAGRPFGPSPRRSRTPAPPERRTICGPAALASRPLSLLNRPG